MLINNHYNNNNSAYFTAHCVQIRDAQWVCNTLNQTLPHFSTSKFKPFIERKFRKSLKSFVREKSPIDMITLCSFLDAFERYI